MAVDSNWIDIIPPAPPPTDELSWLLLILPLFVVAVIMQHYWRRPRSAMRRQLRQLRRQLGGATMTDNQIGFRIAGCLRQAFATPRLDRVIMPEDQQAHWQDFIRRLQQLQYARNAVKPEAVDELLQEAIGWLQR